MHAGARGRQPERRTIRAAVAFAATLLLGACGDGAETAEASRSTAADPSVAPGLWERRSVVLDARGPDLPIVARQRMLGPRPPVRFCVGETPPPPASLIAGGRCTYRTFSLENGQLTGVLACSDAGGSSEAQVAGRYGPESYDLRIEIANRLPDGAVLTLNVRTVGRRLGPCPSGGEERR